MSNIVNTEQLAAVHPRLKLLSYSSRLDLHSCPRKLQLNRLRKPARDSSVTFAFGHVVGLGLQLSMQQKTIQEIYFQMFLAWDTGLYEEETTNKKSFWYAMFAVQQFHAIKNTLRLADGTDLKDYDLAYLDGKPAVELSFRVDIMQGFSYRGYVDVVLRHKITGEFLVLELKTTKYKTIDEATYKNSGQALGYGIILDAISPGKSSYRVLYCIYKTVSEEFELMSFDKSFTKRADWIRDLVLDVNMIGYYSANAFPMHGESCYAFFRQCEFFNICSMSDKVLINYEAIAVEDEKEENKEPEYQINISLLDLINSQIERNI